MPALSNMKRLWVHEILRVFGDRLVDDTDLNWLLQQTGVTLKKHMEVSMEDLFEDLLPRKPDDEIRVRYISPSCVPSTGNNTNEEKKSSYSCADHYK